MAFTTAIAGFGTGLLADPIRQSGKISFILQVKSEGVHGIDQIMLKAGCCTLQFGVDLCKNLFMSIQQPGPLPLELAQDFFHMPLLVCG
nr:hypothetical protein [Roseibium album]